MPLLLISGRPGAGKSTFCEWLVEHRGFVHVETDDPATMELWRPFLADDSDQGAIAFRNGLRAIGDSVVFEWGFLPDRIDRIAKFRLYGVGIWWFDGDPDATRANWMSRPVPLPTARLDDQLQRIDQAWPDIKRLYRNHIVQTVQPGPSFMAPEDIARTLGLPAGGLD